jgi:hypothetical protein
MAKRLAEYGVQSAGTIRITGKTGTFKGYRWAAFEDAWERYIRVRDGCDGSCDVSKTPKGNAIEPMNTERCYGVTVTGGGVGEEARERFTL